MTSSQALFTPVLEITFDLLERANALALEMAFAGDRVNGCCRKSMLNLQPIAHHALKQFALYFCHNVKLPFRGSATRPNCQAGGGESEASVLPSIAAMLGWPKGDKSTDRVTGVACLTVDGYWPRFVPPPEPNRGLETYIRRNE